MCNPYPTGVSPSPPLSLGFSFLCTLQKSTENFRMLSFDDHWSFLPQPGPLSSSPPALSPVPSAVDVITIINLARDYAYICFPFSLSVSLSLSFSLMMRLPCEDHFILGLLWVSAAVFVPSLRRLRQRRRQIKCLCRLPLIKTYHKFRYEKLFCTISNVAIPPHYLVPHPLPRTNYNLFDVVLRSCVRLFIWVCWVPSLLLRYPGNVGSWKGSLSWEISLVSWESVMQRWG